MNDVEIILAAAPPKSLKEMNANNTKGAEHRNLICRDSCLAALPFMNDVEIFLAAAPPKPF